MKKNRVNEILKVQAERRKKIIGYSIFISIFSVIIIGLIILILNLNKTYYAEYTEKSNVDYKVFLKDNDFYPDDYLEKDNEYVVSLIDYIEAYFDYSFELEESNISFDYTYMVDAELRIKSDDSSNSLYNTKEILVEETKVEDYRETNLEISSNVKIDYNKYNDLVKKFVKAYDLEDIKSELIVRLHVNVLDKCLDGNDDEASDYVVELGIPLDVKTIDIEMNSDVVDRNDTLVICDKNDDIVFILGIVVIVIALIVLILVICLIRYVIRTRTAESIYDIELKKILNNYKSYIQKINNEIDFSNYRVLKVDSFTDMLEIRDTIQQPILMVEDKYKRGTYFMIPSNTKIMYVYGLKITDIKKEMKEKSEKLEKSEK